MRPETRRNLADALAAADHVRRLAKPGWQQDETICLASERLLTIMGEAILRIRHAENEVLDHVTDAHGVIGMRNVIVHGYDALDVRRIQGTIDDGLPRFVTEVSALLAG